MIDYLVISWPHSRLSPVYAVPPQVPQIFIPLSCSIRLIHIAKQHRLKHGHKFLSLWLCPCKRTFQISLNPEA